MGGVVYSKAGHDKGKAYIVVSIENPRGYVSVADGKVRTLQAPKLKNPKHLKYQGEICSEAAQKLLSGELKDSDLICYLKRYDREE